MLPGSRSLFSHGHGQPEVRAAMVIKFCSKASLLPLQGGEMWQSTKLVISYLGMLTNQKNCWIIWENFQQSQVRGFFAALCRASLNANSNKIAQCNHGSAFSSAMLPWCSVIVVY